MVLETARLTLRHFQPSDAKALQAILGDAEVMRFSATGAMSPDQICAWIDRQLAGYDRYGYSLNAVIENSTGQLIGGCGLLVWEDLDGQRKDEIGYRFAQEWWGRASPQKQLARRAILDLGSLGAIA
jgi:RimJ/RimL family protein N-acetyltransferase